MIKSPLSPDSESSLPVAAVDRQASSPPPSAHSPGRRFSGTLSLYHMDQAPYVRFRLCRGYIDDLNRVLPIRVRIQLEGEIGKGGRRGQVEGGAMRFRWEFAET